MNFNHNPKYGKYEYGEDCTQCAGKMEPLTFWQALAMQVLFSAVLWLPMIALSIFVWILTR
jgi:hypothetical protein